MLREEDENKKSRFKQIDVSTLAWTYSIFDIHMDLFVFQHSHGPNRFSLTSYHIVIKGSVY